MSVDIHQSDSGVVHPSKALPRKYVQAIVYLAQGMAQADQKLAMQERRIIDELAAACGLADFRRERWFHEMTEDSACAMLETESAKRGALVVLALLLKADNNRHNLEHAYFSRIRSKLGAEPVTVPVSLESHLALAHEYVGA